MPEWKHDVAGYLRELKLEPTREAEIVEEISQHLNDRYQELLSSGRSEAEARRAVLAELSSGAFTAQLRPVLRSAPACEPLAAGEPAGLFGGLGKDLRFGLRQLRLGPGFALVAILSLALGVGANTAIFQLLDAIRLRTLPVRNPQQLADVKFVYVPHGRSGHFSSAFSNLTTAQWEQIRSQQQAFSRLAAWTATAVNLNRSGEARVVPALYVSGNFFQTLGVSAAAGRLLEPADDERGCAAGAVDISYSFWQREFGGNPAAVGRTLSIAGIPFQIAGVTQADFYGVQVGRGFDVALPLCAEPLLTGEDAAYTDPMGWWLAAIGRLKPGWTLERASAQLAAISPGLLEATIPPKYDAETRRHYLAMRLGAQSAASGVSQLRKEYSTPLWLLMGIAGVVLLIACANLANLMLARAAARQREIAVRLALGASRARLIRQLLAESLLLAAFGALAGVALAQALSRALVSFLATPSTHLFVDLHLDWRVLAFTAGLAILTCALFGLTPAFQASHTAPGEAMKATSRSTTAGPSRFGLRRGLVVSQVALSLMLVVAAVLFVRTFTNLVNLDTGFRQDHLLVADIDYSSLKLPKERRVAYKLDLVEQIRAIPGVEGVAAAAVVPLSGNSWNDEVQISGSNRKAEPWFNQVTPGYFRTMGTAMIAGRDFQDTDDASAPLVAIVNQEFARKLLDSANPVGKTFQLLRGQDQPRQFQIVGLVADSKYDDLREADQPLVYLDESQTAKPDMDAQLIVRSATDLESLTAAIKRVAAQASPEAVINFTVVRTMVRNGLIRERLMATLSGFFGGLAALLAVIGLYGVISYMVVRRRNEIGIRMALGANRSNIVAMVMREAATLLAIGVAIGAALALAIGSTVRALLFGVTPSDPATLVVAIAGLALVAATATLLPAQRAAALDPMIALRDE